MLHKADVDDGAEWAEACRRFFVYVRECCGWRVLEFDGSWLAASQEALVYSFFCVCRSHITTTTITMAMPNRRSRKLLQTKPRRRRRRHMTTTNSSHDFLIGIYSDDIGSMMYNNKCHRPIDAHTHIHTKHTVWISNETKYLDTHTHKDRVFEHFVFGECEWR